MRRPTGLRTWIEISRGALVHNVRSFRSLVSPSSKLLAVVKSNAYGHGLYVVPPVIESHVDGFCVDSAVEGFALRRLGIKKPILVLGQTLSELLENARKQKLAVTISEEQGLRALLRMARPPTFHIKVDTGMRRRGFLPQQISGVIRQLQKHPRQARHLAGVLTHFARTGDAQGVRFTQNQYETFEDICRQFKQARVSSEIMCHCSATGGALLSSRYHMDAVRIGIGLYGHYPNLKLEEAWAPILKLKPALAWKAVVGEIKIGKAGESVGYDGAEVLDRRTNLGVLPVGYWHGLPRVASSAAFALIRSKACRIVGRVSMDICVIACCDTARVGDVATLIGPQPPVRAEDLAASCKTINYEIITRLNPLIERVLID